MRRKKSRGDIQHSWKRREYEAMARGAKGPAPPEEIVGDVHYKLDRSGRRVSWRNVGRALETLLNPEAELEDGEELSGSLLPPRRR